MAFHDVGDRLAVALIGMGKREEGSNRGHPGSGDKAL